MKPGCDQMGRFQSSARPTWRVSVGKSVRWRDPIKGSHHDNAAWIFAEARLYLNAVLSSVDLPSPEKLAVFLDRNADLSGFLTRVSLSPRPMPKRSCSHLWLAILRGRSERFCANKRYKEDKISHHLGATLR